MIPIIRVGEYLLLSLKEDLSDEQATNLLDDISNRIDSEKSSGLLIDISALEIVDSFIGRVLTDIARTAGLQGTQTVLCGMRPEVAITIVELGVHFEGIKTALDAELGMQMLRDECDRDTQSH